MSTDSLQKTHAAVPAELFDGNRLDQPTFHRLYEQTPEDFKAELIGGIVHVASPLRMPHGRSHRLLMAWLSAYCDAIPGTDACDNTTVILADGSEPQPDAFLRYDEGTSYANEDDYCVGAPELIIEVSHSTVVHDLFEKRADYERNGVREYLVLVIPDARAVWFGRDQQEFVELSPTDGTFRSQAFPGLWLDADALFQNDYKRLMAVLNEGLASVAKQ